MTLAAAMSAAITLLQAAPGFATTVKTLIGDIENHSQLSASEKESLIKQARSQVDAANDAVQAYTSPA